eukprot:g2820.t1
MLLAMTATMVVLGGSNAGGGAAAPSRPSPGCSPDYEPQYPMGASEHTLRSADVGLPKITRAYKVVVPDEGGIHPLLIQLHGQYGKNDEPFYQRYEPLWPGYVFVAPQGIDDNSGKDCGTGWNTGANGLASGCNSKVVDQTCCYQSCIDRGACTISDTSCAWSTCYDDTQFIAELIDEVAARLCVDLNRVFVVGQSNGAMLSWELAGTTLQHKVAAIMPMYGLPLLGNLKVPSADSSISVLYMGGRQDLLIPPTGSCADMSQSDSCGWLYEPHTTCLREYAKVHGCTVDAVTVATPVDGQDNMACVEYPNCASGKRVVGCLYDQGHDDPSGTIAQKLQQWFIQSLGQNGALKEPSASTASHKHASAGVIGGSVVGGLALIALLVGSAVWHRNRRRFRAEGGGTDSTAARRGRTRTRGRSNQKNDKAVPLMEVEMQKAARADDDDSSAASAGGAEEGTKSGEDGNNSYSPPTASTSTPGALDGIES